MSRQLQTVTGSVFLRSFLSIAVAILAIGLAGCDSADEAKKPPALPVKVIEVATDDVQLFLEMVGTTMGTQDVPIRARVEGFLESVDFAEGSFIKAGSLLYTIDDEPFLAKVVEAESQLAAAKTNLAKTEADLSRIKPLAEMKAVSEQDLDAAVASEAASRAGVRASEAALDLTNINLSYTRIIAPIDGLIGISKARPGEFVGREPNPVVLNTLSDINPIRVRFSISESEYLILARTYLKNPEIDDAAEVAAEIAKTDAAEKDDIRAGSKQTRSEREPDLQLILADGSIHPFKGKTIASAQSIDVTTGTFSVEASFPNPNRVLLPGQFARVKARYQKLEDVIVIPRQALIEIQGLFRVYVVDENNAVVIRSVELGPYTGNNVVIESGLAAGDTLIVEGLQKVRGGTVVDPQPLVAAPQATQ